MNAKLKLFCLFFVVCTLTYLCKKSKSVESELFMRISLKKNTLNRLLLS